MDINKEFEKLVEEFEKEWHDGHEPQGIDDQYVEEMEEGEEVDLDELVAPGKKSATGYTLYHKDFSSAMQHAYDHAKKKGHVVDPKEIDDKVAVGPKKPSKGKVNRYALKAGRKTVQIQVTNLDNKAYELNMYIEDYDKNQLLRVKHDEALIAEAGDICALNRGVLRSKSMQEIWEKKCAPKLDNQKLGEDKMEKLVDTVRKVLMGEGEGDQAEYQKKRKAVAKKFGVESCSALKDEAKRKECYNALDKAHVADHEEQVELKKMNKEEVEVKKKVTEGVDLKKLKKEYDKNEDKNHHTENYLLLAKAFGTSSEVKKVQEIMKRNQKQGSTSKSDMDWMYKNINPYYDKIRNEEVKVEKTISKLFSHVRKLMSK